MSCLKAPHAVTCNGTASQRAETYSFDWGDGTSPTSSVTGIAAHTYATRGAYTVTLTVTNGSGSDSVSKKVKV